MAYPTSVNDQITDSVSQSNVQVLAVAPPPRRGTSNRPPSQRPVPAGRPSVALGTLYQATAQALANAAHNATAAQQNMNIAAQAAATAGVALLYGQAGPDGAAAAARPHDRGLV